MCTAFHLEPVAFKNPGDHRLRVVLFKRLFRVGVQVANDVVCLLYTSDAADE